MIAFFVGLHFALRALKELLSTSTRTAECLKQTNYIALNDWYDLDPSEFQVPYEQC